MGQIQGKATIKDEVKPFANLVESSVKQLKNEFDVTASNWGLNEAEFVKICSVLASDLEKSEKEIAEAATALFAVFDTDKNSSVDALEFLASIAIVSAMDESAKHEFVFGLYDFDESKKITSDEATLSLRSSLRGLDKISGCGVPALDAVESVTTKIFASAGEEITAAIDASAFQDYCKQSPNVSSYINYFEDTEEVAETLADADIADEDLDEEGSVPEISDHQAAVNDDTFDDLFGLEDEAEGDQFMAVKPWFGTVENSVPSAWGKPAEEGGMPPENTAAPDANVVLEWVHGYRAFDTRNNLRYTGSGEIAYHAAALGIVYSKKTEEAPEAQRFSCEHTDDIVSFAMHPNGKICATGEMGRCPKIVVWDTTTMTAISTIKGFHKRAVQHLDFSPDGTKLASIGNDNDNRVAVYEWATGKKIFSAKTNKNKVLDCRWASDDKFASCGKKHIFFWKKDGKTFKKKKGIFGKKGTIQPVLSLAAIGGEFVSGTASGHLYQWENRNCRKAVEAHKGSVNSLYYSGKFLVSGGKDGFVKVWSSALKEISCFNIADCGSIFPRVRSVCMSTDSKTILVGTKGSEIFEIDAATGINTNKVAEVEEDKGSSLVEGHFKDELWGLAINPTKPEYVTVGDDHYLRIWDQTTHKCVRKTKLDCMSRAVSYSPDGALIAVGLGGGKGSKLDGAFVVLNEADLEVAYKPTERFSKEWISDIKFSPDGKTLAIGSHDNAIYLHTVGEYDDFKKCEAHNSYITHFDFNAEGTAIQSNCGAYELLYFTTDTGEQNPAGASEYKDQQWATQTCTLGWPVQGIWPEFADGTDINALDTSSTKTLIATADDFGKVKIFRYPCLTKGAASNEFRGHSSHVTNLRFTGSDTHVISVGGNDRCVFQWKTDIDAEEEDGEEPEEPVEEEAPPAEEEEEDEEGEEKAPKEEPDSDQDEDLLDGADLDRSDVLEKINSEDMTDMFELEATSEGDQFMATKPWVGAIKNSVPDNAPAENTCAPDSSLELEWVHGYRAQDSRSNCFYNSLGQICYPAAGVGIIFDKKKWTQKFNVEHTDDIICLAMSPDRKYVATGQMGKTPLIIVWDALTGQTVSTIRCGRIRAVCALAFSSDGTKIAAVGQDNKHTLFVYNWREGSLQCKGAGDGNKVLAVSFSPDDKSVVTAGVKSFRVWSLKGRNLKFKKGLFGKAAKIQPLLSIGWLQTAGEEGAPNTYQCVLGAKDGSLCKLDSNEDGSTGRKIADVFGNPEPHATAVNTIFSIPLDYEGDCPGGIISGDDSGKVQVWKNDASQHQEVIDLGALGADDTTKAPIKKNIRSVCMDEDGTKILVGTKGSEIYEFEARAPDDPDVKNEYGKRMGEGPLVQAHCKDELWGLAINPKKPEYCTVGDDKTVRVWDLNTKKLIKMTKLNEMARAVSYSPDGSLIAVGLGGSVGRGKRKFDGAFEVLVESDLSSVYRGHESHEWIQDVKFSPDGNTLAIASHDNTIYLHSAADWSVRGKCEAHSSFITHFDFDAQSANIQSNCGAHELLYFDANTAKQVKSASDLKNTEWATQTCVLGWPVQGIWPAFADGSDINAVDKSADASLIVSADDYGTVKLFNYPCLTKGAACHEYGGHSSHVTNARFTGSDSHVITTGGNDRCVFQWRRDGDDAEDDAVADEGEADGDLEFEAAFPDFEFTAEDTGAGDERLAVEPWKGAIQAPSAGGAENTDAPSANLELEWVHGYRAQDARNNLFYNDDGDIVYSAAGVGVSYDKSTHTQKHYTGHDDDIISLAVSADGCFVATGQMGKRPLVHVWDAKTCAEVCVLPRFHKRAIPQVTFSPDGNQIASVGQDDDHSIAVWETASGDWTDGKRRAKCKGSKNKTLFVQFTGLDDYSIVSGGDKHIKFYKMSAGGRGKALQAKKGIFGKKGTIQPVLCASTIGGKVVTGTQSGQLYSWENRTCVASTKAHDSSVNAMYVSTMGESQQLVTGGKDGLIKVWSAELEPTKTFNLADLNVASIARSIRSVCVDENNTRVLVGTFGSEIYEIQMDEDNAANALQVVQGHCWEQELWGLAMHPTDEDLYATCGDDCTVRVWSVSQKRALGSCWGLKGGARALAWKPDGTQIAVGMGTGKSKAEGSYAFVSVTAGKGGNYDLAVTSEGDVAKEWISDVKYSPDGSQIAIGSHDNKIYLLTADGSVTAKCEAHNSYITHVDYTADGKAIRSTCGGYELLFHSTENGNQDPSGASKLKDAEWASETCTLGWGVQGIWPEAADGTDINAVCKSGNGELLATADDFGKVNLYNYPCITRGSGLKTGKGHSSHVTNVRFTKSDSTVVTTGGKDRSVLQWKVSNQ